ncbi:MAG: 30S ribosomal protein S6 [Bacillota bacterium]
MNKYQMLFIINIDTPEDKRQETVDKIVSLVETQGGEITAIEKWGVKKFAYPINFKKEGYYVLMKFVAPTSAPAEIDRQMKFNEDIVRQMINKL